jgi:hypothetical protein
LEIQCKYQSITNVI